MTEHKPHISRAVKLAQVGVANPLAICNGISDRSVMANAVLELDSENKRLRGVLKRIAEAPWKSATATGDLARQALDG